MTPRTLAVLGAFALSPPAADPARALDAGAIVAGSPGSTAFRVGQDIAGLARRFGVTLEVVPSWGGLGNIEALTRCPGTQLAIVPSDVLDFVTTFAEDPELRPMAAPHAVFPLHAEEVHVLARPEVATFAGPAAGPARRGGGAQRRHTPYCDAAARRGRRASRTIANLLSIGLVLRTCFQCSAGKP